MRPSRSNRIDIFALLALFYINFVLVVNGDDYVHDDTSNLSAAEILLRLYDSTRGLRWKENENWLQGTDVCVWHGISCYDSTASDQRRVGHIRKINLSQNRLQGTVPQVLFELPYIESLVFRENSDLQLTFEDVGKAQYLKELDVAATNVKTIDGLEDAKNLETLYITNLGLTGEIPSNIFRLTNLKEFYSNYNHFEGSIPTRIGRLTFLTNLFLYENKLTGQIPSEIGLLSNLKSLSIAQNAFEGTLPTELNQCTKLEVLAISRLAGEEKGPGITGPLPSFAELREISSIDFSNQRLSGPIPENFISQGPKSEVVTIDLTSNNLDGAVPESLKDFHQLELDLGNNQISDVSSVLCSNIDKWMGGDVASLGCDAFLCRPGFAAPLGKATQKDSCRSCAGAEYWGTAGCSSSPVSSTQGGSNQVVSTSNQESSSDNIGDREILVTFYNRMGGRYWKKDDNWLNPAVTICDWHGVQCNNDRVAGIILQNNDLSNTVPKEIFSLSELKILDLSFNSIDFPFEGAGSAQNLETLDLTNCDLKSLDNIEALANTNIKTLSLASNYLQGTLDIYLFALPTLVHLDISHNRLEGTLPALIGSLSNIEKLNFAGNSFTGQIPTTIGDLENLIELSGSENDFEGTLPDEFNKLLNLETFSLHQTTSKNGIGGRLPSFRDLGRLTKIHLDSNKLTGSLPADFLRNTQRSNYRIEVLLSDNRFEGAIPSDWASRFARLMIDLSGNMITSFGDGICDQGLWMDGSVQQFSCDAILCPMGTFNPFGRKAESGSNCQNCNGSTQQYLGSIDCNTKPTENKAQIDILTELYNSVNGKNWVNKLGWLSSDDPCKGWFGIECSASGEVIKIDLKENNLQGLVGASIFQLPKLQELDLRGNKINFSFDGIAQASNLKVLQLSDIHLNSIRGIGQARSLTELHLTNNDIEGQFPDEILQLTNLRDIYLNFNSISGKIPPEISSLRNLENLFLFHNRFEGQIPGSIGRLSNLKTLALSENNFSGTLPPELNDLMSLEVLALQREGGTEGKVGINQGKSADKGTGITGPLLAFDNLRKLRQLYLGVNSLSGTIPNNFLGGLETKEAMVEVDLISNQLTGAVPASLAQFDQMLIYLADNQISEIAGGLCTKPKWMAEAVADFKCDAILCPPHTYSEYGRQQDSDSKCAPCSLEESAPFYGSFDCLNSDEQDALTERSILEAFFLATNGRNWKHNSNWLDEDESICSWYGVDCVSAQSESVESLNLVHNGLIGSIPKAIYKLPNLKRIDFSMNNISTDFHGISTAEKLENLNLGYTGLNSLAGIQNAENLKILHVDGNDFRGIFPSEVTQLRDLMILDISDNAVGDNLPSSLQNQKSLVSLSCSNCGLKGALPSWLETLSNLENLQLAENSFTGSIPSFESMSDMKHLDLSDQLSHGGFGLSGTLPAFAGLEHLTEIFLEINQIRGTIPQSFLQSVDVKEDVTVDLRWNNISGMVPVELARDDDLNLYLAGNKIDELPGAVCATNWNEKAPTIASCDFVLCQKGTFNALGRATPELPCSICPTAGYNKYYGSTECGKDLEKEIVISIYTSLSGPDWTHSDGWRSGDDICSWFGITCYKSGYLLGRVKKIDLSKNNLKGRLNSKIWELAYMTDLNLGQNDIEVSFGGMGNAQNLRYLLLSETKTTRLSGIKYAPALKELHLTNNDITGTIPEELFDMTQLEGLYLNFNQLSGTLSTNIGKLSSMKELYLFGNNLNGTIPTEFGALADIEVISIGKNKFTGYIPYEFNWFEKLRILSLQRDEVTVDPTMGFFFVVQDLGLTGPIMPFNNVPNLQELYLGDNHLQGTLPDNFLSGIKDKTGTIKVDLTSNLLHGGVPTSLGAFSDLRLLLSNNQIHEIPTEICEKDEWMNGELEKGCDAFLCPPGTYNDYGRRVGAEPCHSCSFRGSAIFYGSTMCGVAFPQYLQEKEILHELYSATNGDSWSQSENWMDDNVPVCDWYGVKCATIDNGDTHQIIELSLPSNGLQGLVPSFVFYLRNLRKLNLRNNDVSLVFSDMATPLLEEMYLDSTRLHSLVGIGQAINLRILRLFKTELGGQTIPDELFNLEKLQVLDISENNLVGTIPTLIGKLTGLTEFISTGNLLSGEIPSEIGKLTKLMDLFLSNNDLHGTLPASMGNITSLERLHLEPQDRYRTGVSGPLPSFSKMPKIREIHLSSNVLTGTIPNDFLVGVDDPSDSLIVNLKANQITGVVPGALSRFDNLAIDLTANQITQIDPILCEKLKWMDGDVGKYHCNGLLCPVGTFNELGRVSSQSGMCDKCEDQDVSPHMGRTKCFSVQKMEERKILELLYESTGGSKWKRNDNWMNEQVDICNWYGISCRDDTTVESISLGSNNLKGTPPKEIFGIKDLKVLWLYSNPINFGFDGIGQAKSLTSLLLDSTGLESLSGVGDAVSLVDLDVRFNRLKGPLPAELGQLRHLESLSASSNDLSGIMPSFSQNVKLNTLRLGSNRFLGTLPTFATHPRLHSLDLSDNQLYGSVPDGFLQMVDTSERLFIDLSSNTLSGIVPGELSRFDDLTIFLKGNMIEGLHPSLCSQQDWNEGDVGLFDCDGILCPPNTYSPDSGRVSRDGTACMRCNTAKYFGATTCTSGSSSNQLMSLPRLAVVFVIGSLTTLLNFI